MEEPQEEQAKPAKKQLRVALQAAEDEALTVETNAKSYIETNNENQVCSQQRQRSNAVMG